MLPDNEVYSVVEECERCEYSFSLGGGKITCSNPDERMFCTYGISVEEFRYPTEFDSYWKGKKCRKFKKLVDDRSQMGTKLRRQ